ncbi:recombinase family protein, partial [Listeria monocytogenes]
LASLNASGIVSTKTSFEEQNKLQLELKNLQEEQQKIINSANGKSTQRIELEELYRFTKRSNMLTEWEELLFSRFADQVIVYNRQEVGFKLKCGLILKERLPE